MIRLLVTLLWIAVCVPAATLTDEERTALLGEANALFRQANELSTANKTAARDLYERSALRYERIVREGGVANGKLFYNIGNAWFLRGDIGRAILNYRRAELFIPGDPNLEQNLEFARGARLDTFEDTQETQVLKTLLFWHYDLSIGTRSLLFAFLSGLFWIGAAVNLARPRVAPRPALVAAGLLGALFLGSVIVESTSGSSQEGGVILAQQVIARKGDGESYEPSFEEPLHAGAEFRLLQDRSGWLQVELPDSRRCWVPAKTVGLVSKL